MLVLGLEIKPSTLAISQELYPNRVLYNKTLELQEMEEGLKWSPW